MEWDSPWGKGFPGWHIECSAMSLSYLQQPIDIHCGGMDHVRVHHTNEIAQAEAATGEKYAQYWLHGEFLVVDKGKMAKSGDNFLTVDTLKQKGVDPLALRMFFFSAHYRSPLMFSWEGLLSAGQGLINLKKLIATEIGVSPDKTPDAPDGSDRLLAPFWEAVCDDFNMPVAMASVWTLLRNGAASAEEKYYAVKKADAVLGLGLLAPKAAGAFEKNIDESNLRVRLVARSDPGEELVRQVLIMVKERNAAKSAKNFAKADEIRGQLKILGVEVKDLPGAITQCTFQ
jgi:cysteinyl-tRNA synthetase